MFVSSNQTELLSVSVCLFHGTQALQSGHLGGLATDVMWTEPVDASDPVVTHPKVSADLSSEADCVCFLALKCVGHAGGLHCLCRGVKQRQQQFAIHIRLSAVKALRVQYAYRFQACIDPVARCMFLAWNYTLFSKI